MTREEAIEELRLYFRENCYHDDIVEIVEKALNNNVKIHICPRCGLEYNEMIFKGLE